MHMYIGKQGGGMAVQEEGHKITFSKKGWFFENDHLKNNLGVALQKCVHTIYVLNSTFYTGNKP